MCTSVTVGEGHLLEIRAILSMCWIIWKHSRGLHSSMSSEFFCMILSQAWPGRDVSCCCPLHAVCESLSSPSRTRASGSPLFSVCLHLSSCPALSPPRARARGGEPAAKSELRIDQTWQSGSEWPAASAEERNWPRARLQ